ncbi:MAG: hypothetical protein IJ800_06025 [Clostridia bacterium]|nr:hypothetical protein [Clostridia bacterium]
MKRTGKFLCALTSAAMVFAIAACGGGTDDTGKPSSGGQSGSKDDAVEITIYAGGSSEYQWVKGSREEEVYQYISDLYYEETGTRLKFNVQFMAQNMKTTMVNQVTEGTIDVVISHVGGGDGLDDWMLGQSTTLYRDLSKDYDRYANLGKYTEWSDGESLTVNALDRVTKEDGQIIGIPSVITPYKFGILVRKDWMEACGYTDDPAKTDLTLVDNYEDFEAMAIAMKNKYGLNYAVSGAIYEVEKTGLLGAYGLDAGYYSTTAMKDDNGNDIADYGAYINPLYADVLEVESRWIQKGVLAVSPDAIIVNQCEEEFIAESTGIFLQNGTIEHLIEVERACKAQNPDAEFTVLCGLTKDKTSTAKGNQRNSVSTFMAAVTANSPDYKELLAFMNWVYGSADTYNICRYGEKGVHWIDNGDGTYSYPAGFSYDKKPYSGILTLVENQAISHLTYREYTEDEKSWIQKVRKAENYIVNPTVDYLLYLSNRDLVNTHFTERKAMYNFTQNVWDNKTKFSKSDESLLAEFNRIVSNYRTKANAYSRELYSLYDHLSK